MVFRIKSTIGVPLQSRFVAIGENGTDVTLLNLNSFSFNKLDFIFDYQFIESRKIGLKVGGEFRGRYRSGIISFGTPTLYVAKVFGVDKIVDLTKAN